MKPQNFGLLGLIFATCLVGQVIINWGVRDRLDIANRDISILNGKIQQLDKTHAVAEAEVDMLTPRGGRFVMEVGQAFDYPSCSNLWHAYGIESELNVTNGQRWVSYWRGK